jgi:hypothetical protein
MKKVIILFLMLGTMIFVVPSAQAKELATSVSADPQINVRIGRRGRSNRRTRVVTSTRIRWISGYRYRETIRTTYFANGRTRTVVVNRVRLGGRRYRNY